MLVATKVIAQPLTQSELAWPSHVATGTNLIPASIPINIFPYIKPITTVNTPILSNTVVTWTASTGTTPITYWVYGSINDGFTANSSTLVGGPTPSTSVTNAFNMAGVTNYYYIVESSNATGGALYSSQVTFSQLIPPMSDDTHPFGTASASANNSTAYQGFVLGYGGGVGIPAEWSSGTSTTPQWLSYTCTNSPIATGYALYDAQGIIDWKVTYQFQGSTNGSTWDTLDSQIAAAVMYQTNNVFNVNNTNRYSQYRINISGLAPAVGIGANLQIFGVQ